MKGRQFDFATGGVVESKGMKGFDARFLEQYRARRAADAAGAPLPDAAPRAPRAPVRAALPFRPAAAGPVRILGVDTSLRSTGLATVESEGASLRFVDCRPIRNPARFSLPQCLVNIAETLERYLDEFRPDEVAMEGIFFCKNARTSLVLGHARGVVVATCARRGLPMAEYPPARVKQAVTGTGRATKEQMQRMMQRSFGLPDLPQEDAADALAIATAHAHARRLAALRG